MFLRLSLKSPSTCIPQACEEGGDPYCYYDYTCQELEEMHGGVCFYEGTSRCAGVEITELINWNTPKNTNMGYYICK